MSFGCFFCSFYYFVICNCSKIMIFEVNMVDFRVSICVYIDYYIMYFDVFVYCIIVIDVDDFFYVVIFDKFGYID